MRISGGLYGGLSLKQAFKSFSFYFVIFLVIVFGALLLGSLLPGDEMLYSELVAQLSDDNVQSIVLENDVATVKLKNDITVSRTDKKGNAKEVKLEKGKAYDVDIISSGEFQGFMTEILSGDGARRLHLMKI